MMNGFELHPRLAQDCLVVGRLSLCQLLLMNDQQYPWFVLVPQQPDLREIHQLPRDLRIQLSDESAALAQAMTNLFEPEKLNIAAIGNLVPQLHIHHVARYSSDPTWPAPIWGKLPAQPYPEEVAQQMIQRMQQAMCEHLITD